MQCTQLIELPFQVCYLRSGNATSHLAGGYHLKVLLHVHLAGRARRCRHRRFGRDKGVRPCYSPLADPVLCPPFTTRGKLSVQMRQAVKRLLQHARIYERVHTALKHAFKPRSDTGVGICRLTAVRKELGCLRRVEDVGLQATVGKLEVHWQFQYRALELQSRLCDFVGPHTKYVGIKDQLHNGNAP